jgi:hypothetical protein
VLRKSAAICFLFLFSVVIVHAWGFWGHRRINKLAVFTLPPEMLRFYKSHIRYIEEHAVDPDKRRYVNAEEGARHFIDMEYYLPQGMDSIPLKSREAERKYGTDTLLKYGMNPWQVQNMYFMLVKAFKERDSARILKYSAEIGHYIADACVPLHTTWNYNGQMTGQTGIHAFWESAIPELLGENFDYFTGRAYYVERVDSLAWRLVNESHAAVDSVLHWEKELSKTWPQDRISTFKERNGKLVKGYTDEYIQAYYEMMHGMVERRMRTAILSIGSVWMTAWIDAGQPDLKDFNRSDNEPEKQLNFPDGTPMIGRQEN